jgi:hypothetical protein
MATIWAQITTIISADPLVFGFNAFLLICEGISAGCVAAGIVWESSPPDTWKRRASHKLVIWGVVAEVLFSLALFISDEIVSGSQLIEIREQQDKIIVLEKIITPRHWFGPQNGAALGGPTAKSLFDKMMIDSALSDFPHMTALIQVVSQYEARRFASEIEFGLRSAGWEVKPLDEAQSHIGPFAVPEGVQIWTSAKQDDAWKAAEALQASMSSRGVYAESFAAKLHRTPPVGLLVPAEDIRNSPPEGTVVILIGEKPGFAELAKIEADEYRASHPNER